MNQALDQELKIHINQSFQSGEPITEENERDIELEDIAFQLNSLDNRRQIKLISLQIDQEQNIRLNEVLLAIQEMGFNSFLAHHIIHVENINIHDQPLDQIISDLIQRILQKEEENESLELIRSFQTNIQINSFQSSPSKEKQGPKLIVTSKPLQEIQVEEEEKLECSICMNKKVRSEMQNNTCPCKDHIFCNECIENYLKNLINTSQIEVIKCPSDGCEEEYTENYLNIILNAQLFEKYIRFKRIKIISKNPNVKWCPRLGCQEYVVGPPEQGQEFLQCSCGERICFLCGHPYHQGITCQNVLDKTYKEALKKYTIQPCPKCQAPIQKLSGCNHMTCFKCQYQFCWLCRMKYFSGHYKRMSLLGCYGGQFDHSKPSQCPILRIGILFIPRLVLILALFLFKILRILFFVIWWSVYLPQAIVKKTTKFDSLLRNKQPKWKYRLFLSLLVFLGIVLLPITLIFMLIPGSCILLYKRIRE